MPNLRDSASRSPLGRGESTPQRLRIYANRSSIVDFSEAESTEPQLDIQLSEGQVEATEYPLRVAAFANVTSLSLYFVSGAPGLLVLLFSD